MSVEAKQRRSAGAYLAFAMAYVVSEFALIHPTLALSGKQVGLAQVSYVK